MSGDLFAFETTTHHSPNEMNMKATAGHCTRPSTMRKSQCIKGPTWQNIN